MYSDQLILNLKYELQCAEAQLNKWKYMNDFYSNQRRKSIEGSIALIKARIERLEKETKA